ncbi:MAG: hypothetical protein WCH96_05045 [Betaproteobacteria bacterium]|jgi:hypothetical protein
MKGKNISLIEKTISQVSISGHSRARAIAALNSANRLAAFISWILGKLPHSSAH